MFLLFSGMIYYAQGGWNDYQGSYFTADEAKTAGQALILDGSGWFQWFHIVDLDRDEIVHEQGRSHS